MADRTIDLRNLDADENLEWENGERQIPIKKKPEEKTRDVLISWTAAEYRPREQHQYWFLIPGGIALLFVIVGILSKNYFFIAFIALAFTTFMLYVRSNPRRMRFSITPDGIFSGKKLHEFKTLKSFWIFERPEGNELSLHTSSLLSPYLRIPLEGADHNEIKKILLTVLLEEEHQEFLSDQIARNI